MNYGMQGRTQLPMGPEQRGRAVSAADPLGREIPCQGDSAIVGVASAARSPATACGAGLGALTYDEEFYEVFWEIRLP